MLVAGFAANGGQAAVRARSGGSHFENFALDVQAITGPGGLGPGDSRTRCTAGMPGGNHREDAESTERKSKKACWKRQR